MEYFYISTKALKLGSGLRISDFNLSDGHWCLLEEKHKQAKSLSLDHIHPFCCIPHPELDILPIISHYGEEANTIARECGPYIKAAFSEQL